MVSMIMTREEAIAILDEYYHWVFDGNTIKVKSEDPCDEFYIEGIMEGEDMSDLDRYAWLNTLFGYDIGRENARQIDSYLYSEMDFETMELCHMDREMIQMVCKRLELDVSFDKWATEEPDAYHYF